MHLLLVAALCAAAGAGGHKRRSRLAVACLGIETAMRKQHVAAVSFVKSTLVSVLQKCGSIVASVSAHLRLRCSSMKKRYATLEPPARVREDGGLGWRQKAMVNEDPCRRGR